MGDSLRSARGTLRELSRELQDAGRREELSAVFGVNALVIDDREGHAADIAGRARLDVATVVVGLAADAAGAVALGPWCDVVLTEGGAARRPGLAVAGDIESALQRLLTAVDAQPLVAAALAVLLRAGPAEDVRDGLAAESALYGLLLGGPAFAAWRAQVGGRRPTATEDGAPLRVSRRDDVLSLVLDRPHVHNAFSATMRDALAEALALATVDERVRVTLRGEGPSFCSGGDLGEFGTAREQVAAHVLRVTRSVPMLVHDLADRLEVRLHGAAVGAGIELAAFAGHVVADPGTRIRLPELSMGLIPGSGGTVSLPRRVGRHRAAWLMLSGEDVDATTAHDWGLVDTVGP